MEEASEALVIIFDPVVQSPCSLEIQKNKPTPRASNPQDTSQNFPAASLLAVSLRNSVAVVNWNEPQKFGAGLTKLMLAGRWWIWSGRASRRACWELSRRVWYDFLGMKLTSRINC